MQRTNNPYSLCLIDLPLALPTSYFLWPFFGNPTFLHYIRSIAVELTDIPSLISMFSHLGDLNCPNSTFTLNCLDASLILLHKLWIKAYSCPLGLAILLTYISGPIYHHMQQYLSARLKGISQLRGDKYFEVTSWNTRSQVWKWLPNANLYGWCDVDK